MLEGDRCSWDDDAVDSFDELPILAGDIADSLDGTTSVWVASMSCFGRNRCCKFRGTACTVVLLVLLLMGCIAITSFRGGTIDATVEL